MKLEIKENKEIPDMLTDNGAALTYDQMREIVKRVNLHEELVKALQSVLDYEKRGADKGEPRIGNGILSIIHEALEKANQLTN